MPQERKQLEASLEEDYTEVLKEAETVLEQCFKDHNTDEVFLSFNGGKDCTVLLDITINYLKRSLDPSTVGEVLKVAYIRTGSPFKEIEEFVKQVERYYGLTLTTEEGELQNTLKRIMERDKKLKACLMGTRRSDPFSENLQFMQKTDSNWPDLLRVSPILNWSYHQIWTYILKNSVPYCCLYDHGYTSIGSTHNTMPNPALAAGPNRYNPAWLLARASLERAGRQTKPHTFQLQPDSNEAAPSQNGLQDSNAQNGFHKIPPSDVNSHSSSSKI